MNLILLPLLIALTCSAYGKVLQFQAVEPQGDPAYVQQTDEGGDVMDRGYLQQTDDGKDAAYVQQNDEGEGYVQQADEGEGYVQQTDEGKGYMQQTDEGEGYMQQADEGEGAGYIQQTDEGDSYMQQTDEGKGYVQQADHEGGDAGLQQTDEGGDGYVQQTDEGEGAGYMQQTDEGDVPGYMQQTDEGEGAGYMQQTDEGGDGYVQQTDEGEDAGLQQTDEGESAGYMQQSDEGADAGYAQQTDEGDDADLQQTDEGGDGYVQQTNEGGDAGHVQQTDEGDNAMEQKELDVLKDKLAKIMKDDDQEAAGMNKIGSVQFGDQRSTDEFARMNMNSSDAEIQVSRHLFRYVGVGYNQITGSPDGDFNHGGIDPGIRSTNHIFGFTYRRGRRQPNQVRYQPHHSCASSSISRAYSGFRSYQSQLSASVNVKGSYGLYAFSASSTFNQVRASSQSQRRVIVEQKAICNLGHILLKNYGRLLKVTRQFRAAVLRLPLNYRARDYVHFINTWGTHIITESFVGTKFIKRYSSTYENSYSFLQTGTSSTVGVSYNSLVASGSISLSLATLNQRVSRGARFGSRLTQFTIGTRTMPLPISMKMVPIFEALKIQYWPRRVYNHYGIAHKLRAMYHAFAVYPRVRGRVAHDPSLVIPVKWPSGRYSLPAGRPTCPVGFAQGCRYQDNEDRNNRNWFYNHGLVIGSFGRDMNFCYCTRLHRQSSVFKWMPGRYCIAKYGDSCSSLGSQFADGYIFWDDEDRRNRNRVNGVLPSGGYGRDTGIHYCCRADGNVNAPILLPTRQPFILYQFGSRGCQRVRGMRVREVIIRTDDEDRRNRNRCHGAHPFNDQCGRRDHRVFMCYYFK